MNELGTKRALRLFWAVFSAALLLVALVVAVPTHAEANSGSECPPTFDLGDLGDGVAVDDEAKGSGYLLWSESDVATRFDPAPANGNASNFIAVTFDGGWFYDNNATRVRFVPDRSDCLVAALDFDSGDVEPIDLDSGDIFGIDTATVPGLEVVAGQWAGEPNDGEFALVQRQAGIASVESASPGPAEPATGIGPATPERGRDGADPWDVVRPQPAPVRKPAPPSVARSRACEAGQMVATNRLESPPMVWDGGSWVVDDAPALPPISPSAGCFVSELDLGPKGAPTVVDPRRFDGASVQGAEVMTSRSVGDRVMFVGDSICQGDDGDATWRYWLRQHLNATSAGQNLSFVGTTTGTRDHNTGGSDGDNFRSDWDANHDCLWGMAAVELNAGQKLNRIVAEQGVAPPPPQLIRKIGDRVTENAPDLLVLNLGTNDLAWFATDDSHLQNAIFPAVKGVVEEAIASQSDLKIILSEVPPSAVTEHVTPRELDLYNRYLADLAAELNAGQSSPRVRVAQWPDDPSDRNAFDPAQDTYDGTHPNSSGEDKIARLVAIELAKFGYGSSTWSNPDSEALRNGSLVPNNKLRMFGWSQPREGGADLAWFVSYPHPSLDTAANQPAYDVAVFRSGETTPIVQHSTYRESQVVDLPNSSETFGFTVTATFQGTRFSSPLAEVASLGASAPEGPSGLSIRASEWSADLSWDLIGDAEFYVVYQRESGDDTNGFQIVQTVQQPAGARDGQAFTLRLNLLDPNETYEYKVAAGRGYKVDTKASGPVSVQSDYAMLAFAHPRLDGADLGWFELHPEATYSVYEGSNPVPVATGLTEERYLALHPSGTTHTYRVEGTVPGRSPASASVQFTALNSGSPEGPSSISADPGIWSAALSWAAVPGATQYLVYQQWNGGPYQLVRVAGGGDLGAVVEGLFPGQEFTYRVSAILAPGVYTKWSDPATVRALPGRAASAPLPFDHRDEEISYYSGVSLASQGLSGDPVNTATGNFTDSWTDIEYDGVDALLGFSRSYNSMNTADGVLGKGWTVSYEDRLQPGSTAGSMALRTHEGRLVVFEPNGFGGFVQPAEFDGQLQRDGAGHLVSYADGTKAVFDADGRLSRLVDWAGNVVTLERNPQGLVWRAWSSRSWRSVYFAYNSAGRLTRVVSGDGNAIDFRYEGGYLSGMDHPGNSWAFDTDTVGRITEIRDGENRLVVANVYDEKSRVIEQRTPHGSTVGFEYLGDGVTTVTDVASGDVNEYRHDVNGRLVGLKDPNGEWTDRHYDANGYLKNATDRLGNFANYTYRPDGQLTSVATADGLAQITYDNLHGRRSAFVAEDGKATSYTYQGSERIPELITAPEGATAIDSANGLINTITNPGGEQTSFNYGGSGDLTSLTTPANGESTFTYDAAGRVLTSTDAAGITTTNSYGPSGLLLEQRHPGIGTLSYTYDRSGRVLTETHRSGAESFTTTYTYTAAGEVETVTDPTGRTTTYSYNLSGELESVTDGEGGTTSYTYTSLGRIASIEDPLGKFTYHTYDDEGRLASVTDPLSNVTTYTYDHAGRLVAVQDPTNAIVKTEYDVVGRPIKEIDAAGIETVSTYDAAGRLASQTSPGETVSFTYDEVGRVKTVTDALGNQTSYTYTTLSAGGWTETRNDAEGNNWVDTYDQAGRIVSQRDPEGNTTTYEYSPTTGYLIAVTDPVSGRTTTEYDGFGRVSSVTEADGGETIYTYDAAGRVLSERSPTGRVTSFTYDAAGRLATSTSPAGTTRYTYDLAGRQISEVDPAGAQTLSRYDDVGRPIEVVDPLSGISRYSYDGAGRLVSETTPTGVSRVLGYDAAGRLLSETDIRGGVTSYTYDSAGRIATVTDPTGNERTNTYDGASRLVRAQYRGPNAGQASYETSFTYDGVGRRTAMADPTGTTSYGYDRAGKTTSVTSPEVGGASGTVAYSWTDARISAMSTPGGRSTSYGYTDAGRVEQIANPLFGGSVSYDYDLDGRVISTNLGSGESRSYGWDDEAPGARTGRLSRFEQTVGGPGNNASLTYDVASRLIREDTSSGAVRYDYDPAGQLVQAGGQAFTYDAGRRTGAAGTYTYDEAARVTSYTPSGGSDAAVQPTYDLAGRLTSFGDTTIEYDVRGLATKFVTTDSAGGVTVQERTYDGDRQLVALKVTGADGGVTEHRFVWDSVTSEVPQVVAHWVDGSLNTYVYGLQREAVIRADGSTDWFAYDHLGSAVATPGTADLVVSSGYGPFGTPEGNSDPATVGFGYRGELHTGSTVFLRNRDYLPEHALFTTPDPLVAVPGTPTVANPYHYADNNPLNKIDPLGLRPTDGAFFYRQAFVGYNTSRSTGARMAATLPDGVVANSPGLGRQALGVANEIFKFAVFDYTACYGGSSSALGCGLELVGVIPVGKAVKVAGKVVKYGPDAARFAARYGADAGRAVGRYGSEVASAAKGKIDDVASAARKSFDEAGDSARRVACRAGQAVDSVVSGFKSALGINSFVPGTLVLLASGLSIPIEDVQVGDFVWAADPVSGQVAAQMVTGLIESSGSKTLVDVVVGGGLVTATGQHPFWVESRGEWVDAEYLQPGDLLRDLDGSSAVVDEVEVYDVFHQSVHNLSVAGYSTFHIQVGDEQVLVHNSKCDGDGLPAPSTPDSTRVGRWMGADEHTAMVRTGEVQVGDGYTTYVASPATADSYLRQAAPGSHYVEFDVPSSSLRPAGQADWAQIPAPANLMWGKLGPRRGWDVPESPIPACNIVHVATKPSC